MSWFQMWTQFRTTAEQRGCPEHETHRERAKEVIHVFSTCLPLFTWTYLWMLSHPTCLFWIQTTIRGAKPSLMKTVGLGCDPKECGLIHIWGETIWGILEQLRKIKAGRHQTRNGKNEPLDHVARGERLCEGNTGTMTSLKTHITEKMKESHSCSCIHSLYTKEDGADGGGRCSVVC